MDGILHKYLVGGFNLSEKYLSMNKEQNVPNHQPDMSFLDMFRERNKIVKLNRD